MKKLIQSFNKLFAFLLAICLLVIAVSGKVTFATENTAVIPNLVKATDLSREVLTPKESVERFIEINPEYTQEVMSILKEKGALIPDNTIKEDLGKSAANPSTLNAKSII